MEYKIVSGSNPEVLETEVKIDIFEGYEPQGGVATTNSGLLIQAMIKKDN